MADPALLSRAERAYSLADLVVIVLTHNEERHLPDCLASLRPLGARVLVVDSDSDDRTVVLARAAGAEVVNHPFAGYASQRQAALGMVSEPWVLFVDADERLTPELAAEISAAVRSAPAEVAGYSIPRRNWIAGRELRGGGWWPDAQLRLLRRARASYQPGREVHELVELEGVAGRLTAPLIHLNYDSLAEFRRKQRRYAALRAAELRAAGERPRARGYLGRPARELWRRIVTLGGYRDGLLGLRLAVLMAGYELQVVRSLRKAQLPESALAPISKVELAPVEVDLSVVIVSYNVRALLLDCLTSLEAAGNEAATERSVEIIVVDNASSDGTADAVRRRFPSVRLIESSANRGFAAGNNLGIRQARGRFIALLNPDTTVVGYALDSLCRYLEQHSAVGVVGPRIRRPDGSTQPTRRRFPTLRTGLVESTVVQDYWRDERELRRYYVEDRSDDEEQEVDWLVGACLVARREAIEQAGLLDERFFMYSEEVEWCHRLRAAGWRIVYSPEPTIVHHEAASSRQDLAARQIAFDTSKVLLFEQLYGRLQARLLRAFLLGSYLLRVGIEGGKGLLGHKRALRRARVDLYLRAFRSGLRPRGVAH